MMVKLFSPQRILCARANNTRRQQCQCRTIVTFLQEPPLDSSIPERPCTVALVQDRELYGTSLVALWENELRLVVPSKFGMPFGSLDLATPPPHTRTNTVGGATAVLNVEGGLQTLQIDITSEYLLNPQVVLMARGPISSWLAQLYLESHSLAGLILVDPLPCLDVASQTGAKDDLVEQALEYMTQENVGMESSTEERELYLERIRSIRSMDRPLLLEPGSVPMMILQSLPNQAFHKAALLTADRHQGLHHDSGGEEDSISPGDVPVVSLLEEDLGCDGATSPLQMVFSKTIGPWIEQQVL